MRVIHCPVNFGGIPMTNVQALKRKGVDARLLLFKPPRLRSDEVDIVLDLPDGFVRQQALLWRTFARLVPETDVFHFYFGQTLVPRPLQFPLLRALRKRSVFHFLGSDIRGKTPAELAYARRADARVVGSYDAIRWVPDAEVVPPAIDLERVPAAPSPEHERIRVVHAPSNRARKGTEHVIAACAQLPVDLDIVERVPHEEALRRYAEADVVVEQLNAGWYGVFAIEAMALGKPVVTFLHAEAVRRTEEAFGVRVPVVSATKETLADALRPLVESREERQRLGRESRAYVEQVHEAGRVADRLLDVYARL